MSELITQNSFNSFKTPSIPKQPNSSFLLTATVLRAPGQAASGPPWGTQQGEARGCRATLRCPGPSRGTVSWDLGPWLGIQERLQGFSAQERQIQGPRRSALGSRGSRGKFPKATSSHTPGQERRGWGRVRGWSRPSLCPPGDMLAEKRAVSRVICDCSSQKLGTTRPELGLPPEREVVWCAHRSGMNTIAWPLDASCLSTSSYCTSR